jgi:hypothetical protein
MYSWHVTLQSTATLAIATLATRATVKKKLLTPFTPQSSPPLAMTLKLNTMGNPRDEEVAATVDTYTDANKGTA